MLIYKATFPNGKSYIGLTTLNLEKRIKRHLRTNNNYYFYNAIKKYGKNNIIWKIIEDNILDICLLKERETFNILKYDTYMPNGYNMTLGGEYPIMYGRKHTIKTINKIKNSKRGKSTWNKGKKLSKAHKKNLSISHKGKTLTNEHRQHIKDSWIKRRLK